MPHIDYKSLAIGIALGWLVIPRIVSAVGARSATAATPRG